MSLNKINFEIELGEICCYIGPNGAGKSTTIKAILGLLKIDEGKINNSIDFSSNNRSTIVKVIEFCFSNYKVINIKNISDSNLESMILKLTT